MNDLVKIGNLLVNLKGFIAFEFDDERLCLWAYLPNASDHQLEYVSFVLETFEEYSEIKDYIESFILNAHPEGATKPSKPKLPDFVHKPSPKSPFKSYST